MEEQTKLVINKKYLKELAQKHGKRLTENSYQEAHDFIVRALTRASQRSTANGRRTIHSRDW